MWSRARRDGARSRGRAWLARVAAAVVAVVMLVGVLRAGARYVYCPSMERVIDAPCCAGDRHRGHEGEPAAELRSRDCCEQRVLGRLPASASTADPPQPLAAPLVGTVPAPSEAEGAIVDVTRSRFERECRAGPMALLRHRAELMVALN